MDVFRPGPDDRFTLSDLGVTSATRCERFDRITQLGERLSPGAGCALFLRDIEARRIIVKSKSLSAREMFSRGRFTLSQSLTDRVCQAGEMLSDRDLLDWSYDMPELAESRPKSFVVAPVLGPAGDGVGAIAILTRDGSLDHATAEADLANLAALAAQAIMLKATLATLQRVVTERQPIGMPPFHKH